MDNPERLYNLQASSLIRLISSVASVSLVAAAGVIVIEAQSEPDPLMQLPAAALTLAVGALVIYASSLAVSARREAALAAWGVCIAALILLPGLQLLPIWYNTPFLLEVKALAPPPWPYAVAIPLLLFLVLESVIPDERGNDTSNLFLILGLASAIVFLFFTFVLVGFTANRSALILIPHRLTLSALTPVAISGLIVLGTVLVRRGYSGQGIALLLVIGLGVEWVSTWSYDGPHFIPESSFIPYPRYPLLPILAGTIPGILTAATALFAGWEVYFREREGEPPSTNLEAVQAG